MGKALEPQQRLIIDRCTANVYKKYQDNDYEGNPPTLKEFREELLKQNEKEAKDVALAIELFSNGSLNTFAKQTNVNIHNRLVCYNILELKKQLQPIAMLVILDSIFNRITANRQKGRSTYVEAGHGLLKIGNSLIPFINKFPKDTELYKLMTTKLNEVF